MISADEQIASLIRNKQSFLVDAGPGSGKTTSLIRALGVLRSEFRDSLLANHQRIACITFTNVAKDEINMRTEFDEVLCVSTIHDFLWSCIKPFQNELREAVIKFNASLPDDSGRRYDSSELEELLTSETRIIYSDRGSKFGEGRIWHDDLIGIAQILFLDNPRLSVLIGAKFPFVFVDEYQDTFPEVVEVLLDRILAGSPSTVVGLFGDKRQSIYDRGVGSLGAEYEPRVQRVVKEENYRCSIRVIELLNRFRDDIQQVAAGENSEGATVFVGYPATSNGSVEQAFEHAKPRLKGTPSFESSKVLYLTHRLIAKRAGYEELFNVYSKRGGRLFDQFKSGGDPYSNFFLELDDLSRAWESGNSGKALSILAKNGFALGSFAEKMSVQGALGTLVELTNGGAPVLKILEHVIHFGLVKPIDLLEEGIPFAARPEESVPDEEKKQWSFMRALLCVKWTHFRNFTRVLRENMPFKTQHGVKGREFDTVIVVLDDKGARWYQYSFGNMLGGEDKKPERFERTSNLFYVCCSRAIQNLVVVDLDFKRKNEDSVNKLFGKGNIILPS